MNFAFLLESFFDKEATIWTNLNLHYIHVGQNSWIVITCTQTVSFKDWSLCFSMLVFSFLRLSNFRLKIAISIHSFYCKNNNISRMQHTCTCCTILNCCPIWYLCKEFKINKSVSLYSLCETCFHHRVPLLDQGTLSEET